MNKKRLTPIFLVLFFLFILFFISLYLDQKKQNKEKQLIDKNSLEKTDEQNKPLSQDQENFKESQIAETICGGQDSCQAQIVQVIDGDTVVTSLGEKIRYVGVNTPEIHHPYKKVECFGQEAKEKNQELVLNKKVLLKRDISDKDKYGRLLRFVYVADLFVNDFLVRNGFANVSSFPPDISQKEVFLNSEKYARENQLGFWSPGTCNGKK